MDFDAIVGFDWDAGNARKSEEKHGVSREEAESVFLDPRLLLSDDLAHADVEARYHALGATVVGRRLHVTFTIRAAGTLIRVISARAMSRVERKAYDERD